MGRKYQDELDELAATSSGELVQWKQLTQAVAASSGRPLLIVASGGAQIAARWLARLHLVTYGHPATVLTPLEATSLPAPTRTCIWLVSQGGRHADIMAAARWATSAAPLHVFGMIGRDDTPLAALIDSRGGLSCSLGTPAGADGFLSTNGLWAMLSAITRVYLHRGELRAETELPLLQILSWAREAADVMPAIDANDGLTIIGDPWTQLGGEDLQVRATEASLAHVWSADYRNLGHGRHFWFADRGRQTLAVFLVSSGYAQLHDWTVEGLPGELRRVVVNVPCQGPMAALAAVAWSMFWTARLGEVRRRDPGRPGVPGFGERLYEGGPNYIPEASLLPRATGAVARKLNLSPHALHSAMRPEVVLEWDARWRRFVAGVQGRVFRAVVFDFDGTLVYSHHRWGPIPDELVAHMRRLIDHGVWIGIATGRGDSVQKVLADALGDVRAQRVLVGYHNGATVRRLTETATDMDGGCEHPILKLAVARLDERLQHAARIAQRRHQCTLTPNDRMPLQDVWQWTRSILDEDPVTAVLPVWLSSHSIDVCEPWASKCNVVDRLVEQLDCDGNAVLRVGDRGAWPGNDFQMLDHPSGISVDECSLHPAHCWNLTEQAGAGPRGVAALLAAVRLGDEPGEFRITVEDAA